MKILMVLPYFYPEEIRGAENYAYNISKRLIEKGFDITVLCSTRNKNKEEMINGIKIIRQKPSFILSGTPIKFNLYFVISKLVEENSFDLISAHTPVPFYADVSAMVSKKYKIPFILTYHNDIIKDISFMKIITKIYNYSFNILTLTLSKKIITPSPYCYNKSNFLIGFKNKVIWIPPGVDIGRYNIEKSFKIYEMYNIPNSSKIILFVGAVSRASQHKGVDDLIKSFKKVLDNIKDIYLVFVGKGDMIPAYKKMCEALGILEKVIFTGFVDEGELIEYYKSSNVVVLPSTTSAEGFGMVLIEGNACGKPVIGTKIGGIQYIIKDGETGLLVPPKDPESLADAIIKLLNDEDLTRRMGENGRRYVGENYTWKKAAELTEKIYREVVYGSS